MTLLGVNLALKPLLFPIRKSSKCRAGDNAVYEGTYGQWTIDEKDKKEVFLYRAGLSIAAASAVSGTVLSFLPQTTAPTGLYDPITFVGMLGFGLSLTQVHMYAASIKRTIQLLYLAGLMGAVYLSFSQEIPVPISVVENPSNVWLVGPFFAAMTGLSIKEGLCYGKVEAALLTFLIPATLLGHLSKGVPLNTLHVGMTACTVLFTVLAARKYSQPIKDDIGDKSVFQFLSLPESEQIEILKQMEKI